MADCQLCQQPQRADTAWCCTRCATTTATRLREAADLWPELETTCAGQARMAEPGPHRRGRAPAAPIRPDSGVLRHYADQVIGNVTGLPFSWAATEVADTVRNTATTWARDIWAERAPLPVAGPACRRCTHHTCRQVRDDHAPPADTPGLLRWLAGQVEWIRHQPDAAQCLDELGYACTRIAPAVDRPRPRVDAGECGSPTDQGPCRNRLSAAPGAAYVHCPNCRATWSATERSAVILAAAEDVLGTTTEISAWLTIHGEPVPEATIRSWAYRGHVLRHGTNPRTGQPWYRLGDVRKRANERRLSRSTA